MLDPCTRLKHTQKWPWLVQNGRFRPCVRPLVRANHIQRLSSRSVYIPRPLSLAGTQGIVLVVSRSHVLYRDTTHPDTEVKGRSRTFARVCKGIKSEHNMIFRRISPSN